MTNYEKIRQMTVDELTRAIFTWAECMLDCPMFKACEVSIVGICYNKHLIKKMA